MKLTIFTPTYNRSHTLERLYISLKNQTNKNFEWLIIDDGSTDNTREIIESFDDNDFEIRYYFQQNSGKHVANNKAIELATGNLFTCLDSDDWLYEDAVEFIIKKFYHDSSIIGMIGLDTYENGEIVGQSLPDLDEVNWIDLRYKYKVLSDKCYVFKTEILHNMKFPQFGESIHMPPSYQLFLFSKEYNFKLYNKYLKYVEYQPDGISSNIKNQYFKSSENYCEYRKMIHNLLPNNVEKIKNIILFNISWINIKLNNNYSFKNFKQYIVSLLLLPISYVLYKHHKRSAI